VDQEQATNVAELGDGKVGGQGRLLAWKLKEKMVKKFAGK
jgi:hypothetical protein